MCIVVDINTLAPVFDTTCSRHPDFVHVKGLDRQGRWLSCFRRDQVQGGAWEGVPIPTSDPSDEGFGSGGGH